MYNKEYTKISELDYGISNVSVRGFVGKILRKHRFEREDGSEGQVGSFLMYDENSWIRVVLWDHHTSLYHSSDFKLHHEIIIIDGYTKEGNNNDLELHVGRYGTVIILESKNYLTPPSQQITPKTKRKKDLERLKQISSKYESSVLRICSFCGFRSVHSFEKCPKCGEFIKH